MNDATPSHRPEPTAADAVGRGLERVRSCWRDLGVAYLLSLLLSLPLAAALRASLADSVRHREAAERLLAGWDGLWHASFAARARGIESTFDAGIVGIGAVLRSLDALLRGALLELPAPIVVAGLAYLAGWVFLSGGLLARYGGDRRGVVRLGALHFSRMLGIAATGWVAWWLVLSQLLPWLGGLVAEHCRDVIDERVHAAWTVAKYVAVWAVMLGIRVVVDYAKVVAISDPACSVAHALRAALAFLRRRAAAVLGVWLRLAAVWLGLLLAYWLVAPGADQGNPFMILIAFFVSQTFVVARVAMRGWGLASAQALLGPRT